jgi:hypothetical protein
VPLTALILSVLPAVIRAVYYPDYPGTDDSFIHAAIVESLRHGQGWGINPGQPVNLSTSPLFTLLMLAVSRIAPDVIVAGSLLTTIAVALGIFGTFVVAIRIANNSAVELVAAALAAANVHLWRWTGTFIEAPLAFAGVIAVLACFKPLYHTPLTRPELGRFLGLGLAIGVLTLLRFECGLLGLAFFVHHLVNDRRYLIKRYACAALGLAVPLGLWGIYAWSTFHGILPTTLRAKTTDGLIAINPDLLGQYASVLGPGFFAGFLLLAIAVVLMFAKGRSDLIATAARRSVLFATFAVSMLAFYYLKTDSLQSPARYLLPAMAVLPLAITPFLAAAWDLARPSMRVAAVGLVSLQFAVAMGINHLRVAPVLARMNTGYVDAMTAAAIELNRRCMAGDVVLVQFDIGVLSYRHDHKCRIADGGALASPELRDLSVSEKIAATGSRFVVESLGAPDHSDIPAAAPGAVLLWSRPFASHSVGEPDRIYAARLFEIGPR